MFWVAMITFTVPGKPCSKNETHEPRKGKGGKVRLSDAAQDFWARVQCAAVQAIGHERCPLSRNVAVVVTSHFTRDADCGASIALVKDALQGIVYRNDKCVVFEASWKGAPDRDNPRTEVSVYQVDLTAGMVHVLIPADCAVELPSLEKMRRTGEKPPKFVSSRRDYRGSSAWEDAHEPLPVPGRYPDGM